MYRRFDPGSDRYADWQQPPAKAQTPSQVDGPGAQFCPGCGSSVPLLPGLKIPEFVLWEARDGMIVHPLDELIAKYVRPDLEKAGFDGSRRRYSVESAEGNMVLVCFEPYAGGADEVNFHVDWALIPAALRAYHTESRPGARPSVTWGLIYKRLEVPKEAKARGFGRSLMWGFPVGVGVDGFGAVFNQVLTRTAIPEWLALLQRDRIMEALADPDFQYLNFGVKDVARQRLALYIDDGDPTELRALIEQTEAWLPDDEMIPWYRARLDKRLAR